MYHKQRLCCAQAGESKKEAVILGGACGDTCLNCGVSDDCRKSHLGEDTQSEYLSAHEQDFEDRNSSSTFSEQRKTMEIETSNRRERVHEVPGSAVAKEQNLVDMSEDCSLASENGVGDWTCLESAMPELPHLLQDSVSLPDCNGSIFDDEEQTEYHSIECGSMLEHHSSVRREKVCPNMFSCGRLGNKEVKDFSMIDSTLPPGTATREEVCENNDRHTHSISAKQDNPLLSALDRAPAEAVAFCRNAEHSLFYSCEESGVCLCGAICTECTAKDAESQFPVSAAVTDENPFFEVEVADKSSHGNTSCLNAEHHENLENILSDSTINQAVDVSSDFRACFTTSRSTSAQVCVSSRAINTEVTMMNNSRAMRWFYETCAHVACNPDGSCGASSTEEILSQFSDRMEKHLDGNTATSERRSQIQEQQESSNELCSSDINTDRLIHVDKEAVKNSASSCCQKILQRAIEAELQILNTHYQMCYQHCLKICKPALEENTFFISRQNVNTELDSSLMLVLEELKKKYISMRTKIKMGIPLDALPPLSVEMNLFPVSFSYVPSKLFRKELCCEQAYVSTFSRMLSYFSSVSGTSEADFRAPELQRKKISVNMGDPWVVCVTDGGQTGDSISSKTSKEQYKEENVEHGCVKNEEGNEDWFDAKEELSAAAFSVISEETKKQQEKQDTVDLGAAKIMESGSTCSFVRVGGLSPSVSEDDLRSHFQKYQISDTVISVNSSNCRHVFLSFKDTNEAKLAVEEMNQKKIKGKPLSVELVNISLENKHFVPQILANKLWHEIQTVDNSQRNYQGKTLASASKSVKGPDATFASEKTHLLPVTSSEISCFTQVPSDTKCPGWKFFTEDKDTGENFLQKASVPLSTNSHDAFIPPNMLNLSNFTKLMKKLQKLHPEASRERIVDALLEVRKNNKGILSGLSISSIMERTSVILRKSTPS